MCSKCIGFQTYSSRWQQAKAQAKKTTTKPKAASKPATKANAAPKKKPLADVDENADDSMNIDHSDNEPGPPIQQEVSVANKKKKTASETYTKVCRA